MRSMSRNRSKSPNDRNRSTTERGRTTEKRSGSIKYDKCIGCKCEDCEKMRKTAKELNVN